MAKRSGAPIQYRLDASILKDPRHGFDEDEGPVWFVSEDISVPTNEALGVLTAVTDALLRGRPDKARVATMGPESTILAAAWALSKYLKMVNQRTGEVQAAPPILVKKSQAILKTAVSGAIGREFIADYLDDGATGWEIEEAVVQTLVNIKTGMINRLPIVVSVFQNTTGDPAVWDLVADIGAATYVCPRQHTREVFEAVCEASKAYMTDIPMDSNDFDPMDFLQAAITAAEAVPVSLSEEAAQEAAFETLTDNLGPVATLLDNDPDRAFDVYQTVAVALYYIKIGFETQALEDLAVPRWDAAVYRAVPDMAPGIDVCPLEGNLLTLRGICTSLARFEESQAEDAAFVESEFARIFGIDLNDNAEVAEMRAQLRSDVNSIADIIQTFGVEEAADWIRGEGTAGADYWVTLPVYAASVPGINAFEAAIMAMAVGKATGTAPLSG